MRDSLHSRLDDLANNPTLSIATYIRPDQPVQWTDRDILVPIEKVRVIGGVIRKFRGDLRIRYAVENGRFWLVALTEEKFDRSEEHTSELQSLMRISYAVFCLKKKRNMKLPITSLITSIQCHTTLLYYHHKYYIRC